MTAADDDIALTLGDLGAGLLDAGYAVTDVQQVLRDFGQELEPSPLDHPAHSLLARAFPTPMQPSLPGVSHP